VMSSAKMLLDEILPIWHFGNHHSEVVDAPVARVIEAVDSLRLDSDLSPFIRLLFRVRGLSSPSGATPRAALTSTGFSVLAEEPGREIVFGIAGKFWAPREMANLVRVPDARSFIDFAQPGQAKGAMNIRVEPLGDDRTLLSTETRVWCTDRRARLLFTAYWTLIRIPSGWIRNDMLGAIARRAVQSEPAMVAG
jgi:hypothetical protein